MTSGPRSRRQSEPNGHFAELLLCPEVVGTRHQAGPRRAEAIHVPEFQYFMPLIKLAYACQSSSWVNAFESCPADPEEAADAYLLSRMSPGEVDEFELHLAKCPRCSQIVETTRAFIQAIRDAARRGLQVCSGPDFHPEAADAAD